MRQPRLADPREALRRIPTTDLYFLNPLRHLAASESGSARLPRIEHLFGNVYAAGRTGVISRYATRDELNRLKQRGFDRLVYIADDDFAAGAADPSLPDRYRQKLAAFAAGPWPALRDAAEIVVASSPAIAAIYGGKARMMHPVWGKPPAGLGHFARPTRIDIVHLGTASHQSDFAAIAPALADLLHAHPRARLTLFSGADLPKALKRHPQVRSRRPMPWWRYKLLLPHMRFHLALYPLRESPFNHARSANKLFEQALVGAASLMSPNPALREAAGSGLPGLFVEAAPEAWRERLEAEFADLARAHDRAEATRARILALDPPGLAAREWRDILAGDL